MEKIGLAVSDVPPGAEAAETAADVEARPTVGYGRPPAERRFKKGRSGNPKGRPKGARSLSKLLNKILSEKVTVSDGDKAERMSKAEALVKLTLNRAIKGDAKAVNGILALAGKSGRLADSPEPEDKSGIRLGALVVPEPCHSTEEWERKHGAAARGEKFFMNNGQRRPEPVIIPRTLKAGDELFKQGKYGDALECYHRVLRRCTHPSRGPVKEEYWPEWARVVFRLRKLSLQLLYAGRYAKSLETIEEVLEECKKMESTIGPEAFQNGTKTSLRQLFLTSSVFRGMALLLTGSREEAISLFMKHRGASMILLNVEMDWAAFVALLFGKLRNQSIPDPLMDEVIAQLTKSPRPA